MWELERLSSHSDMKKAIAQLVPEGIPRLRHGYLICSAFFRQEAYQGRVEEPFIPGEGQQKARRRRSRLF